MQPTRQPNIPRSGISYFFQGFELIQVKGLKRFVLVPLLVNLILFISAFYYLFGEIKRLMDWMTASIPDWLSWLSYIAWPVLLIAVLVLFSFIFTTLANWLAAPFNGLLAEKVERHLSGQVMGSDGLTAIIKDIPRTLAREWRKLVYYLPRAVGFLILFWLLPVVGQIIWFLFCSWMMAIQYCDYAFDNHKVGFNQMRDVIGRDKSSAFGFGAVTCLFGMIPIVNFIVMPVAICGATAMWVDRYKAHFK
nr:sulfate transporter CysZ [Neptunicella marina]